jgi:hypothetical protein
MIGAQVHFEVFARPKVNAPWRLQLATEDRARAIESAEDLLSEGHVAAVRVCKETLDEETREFKTVTILAKGAVEATSKRKPVDAEAVPMCITPQDLYSSHARERIGRLLDGWLLRKSVTPFELLHRPDLIEELDASGVEIQHAVQKIAIPEAQAQGVSTHELIRTFQKLIERAVERVLKDGKANLFPSVTGGDGFADVVIRLNEETERHYLLSGGVAAYLAPAVTWSEKVGLILDLADSAPEEGRSRGLALSVLEQPLSDILGSRGRLGDLVGPSLDLGGGLAALTRLGAANSVKALVAYDPTIGKTIPPLTGQAARLGDWLQQESFDMVRAGLTRRILRELKGPRRLRPSDPDGEIAVLRALAMVLTAASGPLLPLEEVQDAFIQRSKALVAGDFVEVFLAGRESVLAEAQALVRLAENVAGAVNKRTAGRWLIGLVSALRFETELRFGADAPANRLALLAALQRSVIRTGLAEADANEITAKIGEIGGHIESDAKLIAQIVRSDGPIPHRLTVLLRLASGESAPFGPAANKAKGEAVKLLRATGTRAELAKAPDSLSKLKGLIAQAGLAA